MTDTLRRTGGGRRPFDDPAPKGPDGGAGPDEVRADVDGLWGAPWDLVASPAWRPDPPDARDVTLPVLVGLDEGTGGGLALEWALRHAAGVGAPVRVVTAWSWEARVLRVGGRPGDRVREGQQAQLDRVLRRFGPAHCTIETVLGEGDPASLLLEQSRAARLLVVGSHAEPGRPSVGSVARACLRFAHCPVVVVPVRATA